jgi:DHA2 family multidrug resistance protein
MAKGLHMSSGRAPNRWLIALTVSLATFMEVMDTSIANVALRHIAGSMGASESEATWVLTSYLISNAIILPISGWLSSVIGRKRFYMSCVAVFTISSFLCGIAPSLGLLLLFRVLQGAGGGGLAPSEQSILTDTFPASQRGLAFALYGLAVVVAPAIGPALGGWITDTYSWRWIFFINIPVGVLSLFLTSILVQDSAAAKKETRRATRHGIRVDYVGFGLVALGLGCLQVVLDKGQEDDWFGSGFITVFAILAAVGIMGAIIWELWITKDPIVDLPLFKNRGFLITNLMMFAVFFVLLASTQFLPQLVQELLGYNATKAGLTLMPGGFLIMALMPLVGFLVRKVQPKYMIIFGFVLVGSSLIYLSHFNAEVAFKNVAVARMIQAAGVAFIFVPINTMAYSGLPKGKSNNASALINLMRNLGGSAGISIANALLVRRTQVHHGYLAANLSANDSQLHSQLQNLTRVFELRGSGAAAAAQKAIEVLSREVTTQANILGYIDVFQVLLIGCVLAGIVSFFLQRVDLSKTQAAA